MPTIEEAHTATATNSAMHRWLVEHVELLRLTEGIKSYLALFSGESLPSYRLLAQPQWQWCRGTDPIRIRNAVDPTDSARQRPIQNCHTASMPNECPSRCKPARAARKVHPCTARRHLVQEWRQIPRGLNIQLIPRRRAFRQRVCRGFHSQQRIVGMHAPNAGHQQTD